MNQKENFSILNTTKRKVPVSKAFLLRIKNFILKEKYELSLVFINNKKSKLLNLSHRQKNQPANVLSFSLSKNLGEIFIDLQESKKQASKFGLSQKNFVLKLFIHAIYHLKGMEHSSKMDKMEKRIQKHFGLNF